jgi:hypothetical protein
MRLINSGASPGAARPQEPSMRAIAVCTFLILATSCPPSTPEREDGGTGSSGGTGGTGGMAGACVVRFYTQAGCAEEVQPSCFPNNGGACGGGYCACDGKVRFGYCTGWTERFAYRIPWYNASGREGMPCDPKADAPPP